MRWDRTKQHTAFTRVATPTPSICAENIIRKNDISPGASASQVRNRHPGHPARRLADQPRRVFHVRVLRLPGPAPLQAPQSARREDEGKDPSHAERVKRPD